MEENTRTNTGGNDLMEDKLRELTEDTQVPASLEPEQIERMLLKKKKEKTARYRRKYAGIAAAACLCLAVGVTAAPIGQRGDDSSSGAEIGSETGNAGEAAEGESTESETKIASAADYDQIYDYIQAELKYQEKQAKKQARMYSGETVSDGGEIASADSAAMYSGSAQNAAAYSGADSTGTSGYSDTNVREESVGEADVVKTDGSRLYVMSGNRVEIVDIASEEMEEIAAVTVDPDSYIRELYVEGSRMAVFYTQSKFTQEDGIEVRSREFACTDVYDISDPSAPVKLNTFSQSGVYNTMRVKDGYAYVISSFYPDTASPRSDVGAYVPSVQGGTLEADRIFMPEQEMGSEYTVITAFSLADPQEQTDSKAVFGSAGLCYVSSENIYVTETCYDTDDTGMSRTAVRKVAYHDGQLEGAAQAKVDGMLKDSFCIDESNGYIRLVTTITSDNGVMVATLAFGINSGAYVSEIFRSGIMSIDKGQMEAGRSLGLNYLKTMWFVIAPQVLKTVLPTLANEFITLLKETSVAGYVAVSDLTFAGNRIRGVTYSPFMPLIAVAIIYLILVMFLTRMVSKLERRLRQGDNR